MEKGHDLTIKSQSAKDTLHERQLATMLQEEVDQFGDIHCLPMRDQYQDLTNKFLGVAQYAFFRTPAQYLGVHDDEYCLDVERVDAILLNHSTVSPTKELWLGKVLFAGDEYLGMLGIAGMRAPYMSGWYSIFSRRLLGLIVEDDWTRECQRFFFPSFFGGFFGWGIPFWTPTSPSIPEPSYQTRSRWP